MKKTQVALTVDGLRIAAERYVPSGQGPFPVLCVSHGIPPGPRDPSDQGYQVLAERCADAGFATMIFNFRGVGLSEGNLDMPGWGRDLTAALGHILSAPEADPTRVNLLGFSAGAAISVFVAARDRRVTAAACCACPAEFRFVEDEPKAREWLAHLRKIGLVRDASFPASFEDWVDGFREVAPLKWAAGVSPRPLLLVHGDQDDVVLVKHARLLYEKAGQPKDLVILPGAGHRLRREPKAMDIALDWLKKVNGIGL